MMKYLKRVFSIVLSVLVLTQNISLLSPVVTTAFASATDSTPTVSDGGLGLSFEEDVHITWDKWGWANQKVGKVSRNVTVVDVEKTYSAAENFTVLEEMTYTMYMPWDLDYAYVWVEYMDGSKESLAGGSTNEFPGWPYETTYVASLYLHYLVDKTTGTVLKVWKGDRSDASSVVPLELEVYWSYFNTTSNRQEYAYDAYGFPTEGEKWWYSVTPNLAKDSKFDDWTVEGDATFELDGTQQNCMNLSKTWTDQADGEVMAEWKAYRLYHKATGIKLKQLWLGECKHQVYDVASGSWSLESGFTLIADQRLKAAPPTVSITEPEVGAIIDGLTQVKAETTFDWFKATSFGMEGFGEVKVEFSLSNASATLWSATDSSLPYALTKRRYSALLDATSHPGGAYLLMARATYSHLSLSGQRLTMSAYTTITLDIKKPEISVDKVLVGGPYRLYTFGENEVNITVVLKNTAPVDGDAVVRVQGLPDGIGEQTRFISVAKYGSGKATFIFTLSDFDWIDGWILKKGVSERALGITKEYFWVNVTNVAGTKVYDVWPKVFGPDVGFFETRQGPKFEILPQYFYVSYTDDTVKQNYYPDVGEYFLVEFPIRNSGDEDVSYIMINSDYSGQILHDGFTYEDTGNPLQRANSTGLKMGDLWYTSHMAGYDQSESYVADIYEWEGTAAGLARLNFHVTYKDAGGKEYETVLIKPVTFSIYENDKTLTMPQIIKGKEMNVTVWGVKGTDVSMQIQNIEKVYYTYKIDGKPTDFWGELFNFLAPGGIAKKTISVDIIDGTQRFEVQYEKSTALNLLDGTLIAVAPLLPSPFDDVPLLIELLLLVAQEKPPETLESGKELAMWILEKIVSDADFKSRVTTWAKTKFKVQFALGQLLDDILVPISCGIALYKMAQWTWNNLASSRKGTVKVTVADPPEEFVVTGETLPSPLFFGWFSNETASMGESTVNMTISESGEGEYSAVYEIATRYTSLDQDDFDTVSMLVISEVGKRTASVMKGNVTVSIFPTEDLAMNLSKLILSNVEAAKSMVESHFVNMESFETRLTGNSLELRGTGELESGIYDDEVNINMTITDENVSANFHMKGSYAEIVDGRLKADISFGPRFNIPLNNTRLVLNVPYDVISVSPEPDHINPKLEWNRAPSQVTIYLPAPTVHRITWETETYNVKTITNSTLQDLAFNHLLKQISFNLAGQSGTSGFCNVTVPKSLLKGDPWTIMLDNVAITDFTTAQNATHTSLHFIYPHSDHHVVIQGTWAIPEYPSPSIILLLLTTIIAMAFVLLTKKNRMLKPIDRRN
jgi:hypothetical protein